MNPIIERALELLEKIRQKIEEIVRLVNAALRALPAVLAWVADRLREAWDGMLQKISEMWNAISEFFSHAGDPFMLNSAAEGWKLAAAKVSRINDTIMDANLSVDDKWTGSGADQYQQRIETQRRANTSIMADYAENIGGAMTGLAVAIGVFWGAVVAAILALLTALAGAAVATGTIVGLPAVPVLVTLGIVSFLAAIGFGVAILYLSAGQSRTTMASTAAGIASWPPLANA